MGQLYLLGGYIGYVVSNVTGESMDHAAGGLYCGSPWLGLLLQHQVFRRMEGQELRQTMVTIWFFGGVG
jgi:branched-chain amino acid transport system permease protein